MEQNLGFTARQTLLGLRKHLLPYYYEVWRMESRVKTTFDDCGTEDFRFFDHSRPFLLDIIW
jgi:hypothetical protein